MDREAFFWQGADGRLPPPRVAAMLDDAMGPALACQLAAGELFQDEDLVASATATALIRKGR